MGGAQAAKVLEIISLNGLKALIPGMPDAMVQFIGEMLKEDRSKWEERIAAAPFPINIQALEGVRLGAINQIRKKGIPVDPNADTGVLQQMINFIEDKFDVRKVNKEMLRISGI